MTLTLLPVDDAGPVERIVRMRVAVAVTPLGGWVVVGWREAAPAELQQMARLLADDPVGGIRMTTLDVPVIANAVLAELLGETPCQA